MIIINLKEFFYWYIADEYIEVTEEVAAELRAQKRSERVHWQRARRNDANCSLDTGEGIEVAALYGDPSPEELLERMERFYCLWNALNSLPPVQGRRVDAHFILGMTYREIARAEGVDKSAVRRSVLLALREMKVFMRSFGE